ncbi:MAG: hypothetical protein BMS9Abin19_0646 [Gammaproteobacteria bacterium]|nr:MAG: hypothetical protein BMS9Abin19_0646 [Gammaproteobacteria bacterium]
MYKSASDLTDYVRFTQNYPIGMTLAARNGRMNKSNFSRKDAEGAKKRKRYSVILSEVEGS